MLYLESRKGGSQGHHSLIGTLLALLLLLFSASCGDNNSTEKFLIQKEAFADLQVPEYALNPQQVRSCLEHIVSTDKDSTECGRRVRQYYRNGGRVLWLDRMGVSSEADTLTGYLERHVPALGFTTWAFGLPRITELLGSIRRLESSTKSLSERMAEAEYLLTKAFVRYVEGQRYGFANPYSLFNHLDVRDMDDGATNVVYNRLYAIDIERPSSSFMHHIANAVWNDSVGECLRASEPTDVVYRQYQADISHAFDAERRRLLLVNMERRRWRTHRPNPHDRQIFVNVAAQELWAVSPDSIFKMRVVCGAVKTKTPLLTSSIHLIQVNPEWIIPYSIVKKEVSHHAGDSAYFARNNYYITDKSSGRNVDPKALTPIQLASGSYRVAQKGGAGNSLGRIVFRFPNDFSVYLHDTSNPSAFNQSRRLLSHGCVRLQRPFDLACFLMTDADEWLLDRLRISMDIAPVGERGKAYLASHVRDEEEQKEPYRLLSAMNVKPSVPILIDYYTLFPDPESGELQVWPDAYSYDQHVWNAIKPYTEDKH